MKLKKAPEALASLLLVVTGLIGLVIAIADFGGWTAKITTENPSSFVLLTVGMLAIAVGLERVVRFKHLDEQLDRFEHLFASHLGCHYYEGHDETYRAAIRLCAMAQKHIRTLIIGRTAPEQWRAALTERLRESKEANKPIKFQVVVALSLKKIQPNFVEEFEQRLEKYREKGVEHLTTRRILDLNPPVGFDLLIVDDQHVFMGIPSVADEQLLSRALVFENQNKLASELVDWYDQVLVRSTVTFEEIKERITRDGIQTSQ
jgi:hypothetical protein